MSDVFSRRDLGPLTISGRRDALRIACEDYLRSLVVLNRSPRTIDDRRRHLTYLVAWLRAQGLTSPARVTLRHLERYQYHLHTEVSRVSGRRRTASTQSQRLTTIRMFFRFLARTGRIKSDPTYYLELPRCAPKLPGEPLTLEELERVLAQPDLNTLRGIRDRAVLETLFATGIRRAELGYLTDEDVDAVRRTLTVRRGKGGRGRLVPISQRALEWISFYLKLRPGARCQEDERVLFRTMRGYAWGLANISSTVRRYMNAAGVYRPKSCHTFRTTAATFLLENDTDIRYVQEFLGHAKLETTQRYTAVSRGRLHQLYERAHLSAAAPIPPEVISLQGKRYVPTKKDPT